MKLPSLAALAFAACLLPSVHAAVTVGDKLYVDFGKNNGDTLDGVAIASPDANGTYWNTATYAFNAGGGAGFGSNPLVPSVANLVTSTNVATGAGLNFSNGWQANGFRNGGLVAPSSALLGDFAFKHAVGDYFFFDNSGGTPTTCTMTITGLDAGLTYDFKIFASRLATSGTDTRFSVYSITDTNGLHSFTLQTTGTDIGAGGYDGNNNTFAYLTGIVPNASGEITLNVNRSASSTQQFAYISALQLTAVPEPSAVLLGLTGLGLLAIRRRSR
jgi:hypothetical protein